MSNLGLRNKTKDTIINYKNLKLGVLKPFCLFQAHSLLVLLNQD